MVMRLIFRVTHEKPLDVAARRWSEWTRNAHRTVAHYWHEHFLPRHFTRSASSRYGYKKRGAKYEKKKQWAAQNGKNPFASGGKKRSLSGPPVLFGGRIDLDLTGQAKRLLSSAKTIRVFPTRWTLTMYGPRYITMKPRTGNRVWMEQEITTVTDDEQQTLADLFGRSITEQWDRWNAKRTKTISA